MQLLLGQLEGGQAWVWVVVLESPGVKYGLEPGKFVIVALSHDPHGDDHVRADFPGPCGIHLPALHGNDSGPL